MRVVNSKGIENLGFDIYEYERTETQSVYSLSIAPIIAKLPPLIRIEENQEKGNVRTRFVIRGKVKTWSKTILTGLLPIGEGSIYSGDWFRNGKKSFLLFKVSPNKNKIQVLFFNGFNPRFPAMRIEVVRIYKSYFTI